MQEEKRVKDPVYGYVFFPKHYSKAIIDTPLFQRLRRISQTSYCPLYPSATHTRFAHSIGVYYLGNIVASCIQDNSLPELCTAESARSYALDRKKCKRYLEVFRLACLLHDVGHAPFSHTGEDFYSRGAKDAQGVEQAVDLEDMLWKALGSPEKFKVELGRHKPSSANHEIMSAIVGVEQYPKLFKTSAEKEFFARAITGYKYDDVAKAGLKNEDGVNLSFLNCLIVLLNSSVVDVDRLDYVIRDSKVIGFESVSLDYRRLLGGIRVRVEEGECSIVYLKQSVGILENVVFAHDAEKKWIQNHPTIGYEMNLLSQAIAEVREQFCETLFSKEALLEKGILTKDGKFRIRLMSDDDLVFLMKNIEKPSDCIKRFFNRGVRERALWKSETDFEALFRDVDWSETDQRYLQVLLSCTMEALCKMSSKGLRIDDEALGCLKADAAEAAMVASDGEMRVTGNLKEIAEKTAGRKKLMAALAEVFEKFAEDHQEKCDFLLQRGNPFKSGFMKSDLSDTKIQLNVLDEPIRLGDVMPVLQRRKHKKALGVFYVFHSKKSSLSEKFANELVRSLKSFIAARGDEIRKLFKPELDKLPQASAA